MAVGEPGKGMRNATDVSKNLAAQSWRRIGPALLVHTRLSISDVIPDAILDPIKSLVGQVTGFQSDLGFTSGDLNDPAVSLQTARLLSTAYLDQTGPLRPPYFDLAR